MNPAGFLYAGYALRDCLRGVDLPYVEVHIPNLDRRGMHSLMAAEADGMIMGMGIDSCVLGPAAICRLIERQRSAVGGKRPG